MVSINLEWIKQLRKRKLRKLKQLIGKYRKYFPNGKLDYTELRRHSLTSYNCTVSALINIQFLCTAISSMNCLGENRICQYSCGEPFHEYCIMFYYTPIVDILR